MRDAAREYERLEEMQLQLSFAQEGDSDDLLMDVGEEAESQAARDMGA